jgi:hypothetical protein
MAIGTSDGKYFETEFDYVAHSLKEDAKAQHQRELTEAQKKILEKGKERKLPK